MRAGPFWGLNAVAVTLSRNLKLRIDSNLTANARYNLERIDSLATGFQVDSTGRLNLRALSDIILEPESTDAGGSGSGGSVSIGSSGHELDTVSIYSAEINLSDPIGLLDQASSGTKYLRIRYKSDLSGSVDTSADRTLSVDLNGANRSLILGGDLSVLSNNLSLTLPAALALTLPGGYGIAGQILRTDGSGTLSWVDQSGGGDVSGYATDWITADGTSKTVTHNLAATDVDVTVIDLSDNRIIHVDSIATSGANAVVLTASEAPSASSWRVIVQGN